MLEILLSGFRWYRRLRGGRWFQVRTPPMPDRKFIWVRSPMEWEEVVASENWDRKEVVNLKHGNHYVVMAKVTVCIDGREAVVYHPDGVQSFHSDDFYAQNTEYSEVVDDESVYKIRRENPSPSWVGMRGESMTK